jgi:hypothetical protein
VSSLSPPYCGRRTGQASGGEISSFGNQVKTQRVVIFLNLNEIGLTHETGRVGAVSANLSINLNKTLHKDVLNFLSVQSILQAVAQEDDKRKTFTGLVGTSARLRSV